MTHTLSASALRQQCAAIIQAAGSSEDAAGKVASNLVLANLSGHDSHGVGMIPRYVDAVLEGVLNPISHAKTVLDAGCILTVDGQLGYGQVVGDEAMQLALA